MRPPKTATHVRVTEATVGHQEDLAVLGHSVEQERKLRVFLHVEAQVFLGFLLQVSLRERASAHRKLELKVNQRRVRVWRVNADLFKNRF